VQRSSPRPLPLPATLVAALCLLLVFVAPSIAWGQAPASGVTILFDSTFTTPEPLPPGPLDHVLLIVDVAPGAATDIHSHAGPGFATLLQGQLNHHRMVIGSDSIYGPGDTWVEFADDVHWARNEGTTTVRILATFLLPRDAGFSDPTGDETDQVYAAPTVPAVARIPVGSPASAHEVQQSVRVYSPGTSVSSAVGAGRQEVVLVVEGQITVRDGKDSRVVGPGESWVVTSTSPVTSWNLTSAPATTVVSQLSR
jgi:quercetin dioxygenase-like cupin family protein